MREPLGAATLAEIDGYLARRFGQPHPSRTLTGTDLALLDLRGEVERLQAQLADAWDEGLWAGKVLAAQAVGPGPVQHPENPYRRRPSTDELLGADPDYLGGQNVDDYINDIRRD